MYPYLVCPSQLLPHLYLLVLFILLPVFCVSKEDVTPQLLKMKEAIKLLSPESTKPVPLTPSSIFLGKTRQDKTRLSQDKTSPKPLSFCPVLTLTLTLTLALNQTLTLSSFFSKRETDQRKSSHTSEIETKSGARLVHSCDTQDKTRQQKIIQDKTRQD